MAGGEEGVASRRDSLGWGAGGPCCPLVATARRCGDPAAQIPRCQPKRADLSPPTPLREPFPAPPNPVSSTGVPE